MRASAGRPIWMNEPRSYQTSAGILRGSCAKDAFPLRIDRFPAFGSRPVAVPHLPLFHGAEQEWGTVRFRAISGMARALPRGPAPSLTSPVSPKHAAAAEHLADSTSEPSAQPLANACRSPRSPQTCRGANDSVWSTLVVDQTRLRKTCM